MRFNGRSCACLCANRLRLNDNLLTGTLPQLAALTLLTKLYLYDNELTGTLPELAGLVSLTQLARRLLNRRTCAY